MSPTDLCHTASTHLQTLCTTIAERSVGSEGNRRATAYFRDESAARGWETESTVFDAVDWRETGVMLTAGDRSFDALVSPYSLGCSTEGVLACAATVEELEDGRFEDRILLLHDDIAREQLMPKNFVFYNPDEHRRIIALLERSGARALVCATGRNAALAGGVYPFPLIEDGDFDIPSVYMTEEEGLRLKPLEGQPISLVSRSERIPGKGFNVVARRGDFTEGRIVLTAHIDAKKGSPGAIDNATGVVMLLLLAELLQDYRGRFGLEIVAFNGEDYFSAPGQMSYIAANQGRFDNVLLNINIDGAGYRGSKTALSFFDLPPAIHRAAATLVDAQEGLVEGPPWPQGDHSIFLQYGRPAIAVSSQWFLENIDRQDITHTPKDNPQIVDIHRVVEAALALHSLVVTSGETGR